MLKANDCWTCFPRRRFWPLSDRAIHYGLLNDPPLKHARVTAKGKLRSGQFNHNDLVMQILQPKLFEPAIVSSVTLLATGAISRCRLSRHQQSRYIAATSLIGRGFPSNIATGARRPYPDECHSRSVRIRPFSSFSVILNCWREKHHCADTPARGDGFHHHRSTTTSLLTSIGA